jgi:hypothetical protein
MKKHHVTAKTMIAALATSLLLTGTLVSADARDRGGKKDLRVKTTQRQQRNHRKSQKQPMREIAKRKHTTHITKVVTHTPKHTRIVRTLPRNYKTIHVDGNRYYYHNGSYYRHHNHGYEIVHTPRIHRLPRHARRVIVNRVPYYVYGGVYYCHRHGYYEVCEAPYVESRVTLCAGPLSITFTDYDY